MRLCLAYSQFVKQNNYSQDQNQKSARTSRPAVAVALSQNEIDFVPAPDEVSRKAYFSYVNQGSQQGHEVQHWLAAEAELIEERRRTRVHDFHNKT